MVDPIQYVLQGWRAGVELITVHDRKGRDRDPRVSEGKYFTIMPSRESKDVRQEHK